MINDVIGWRLNNYERSSLGWGKIFVEGTPVFPCLLE